MEYKHQLLSLRFQTATGCSEKKANEQTQRYLTACLTQILRHLNKDAEERVYISLTDIQNQLQTIMVKGERFWVFKTFQSFDERIIVPIQIGSNLREELTVAELNYNLEELLIAQGDHMELFRELYRDYADVADDDIDYIPIDMFSLVSFIKGNLNQNRSNPAVTRTVNNYLYHALRIKMIAQQANEQVGSCVMPHIIAESQFGRKYYRGPNLQNTPKIVRHAALGSCHEYDIESSVFAWKYSWFKDICRSQDESVPMPATLEYLDHKKAKRQQLARTVFGSDEEGYVNIIKEAITAIGFGAPARVTGYVVSGKYEPTALNSIITSKTRLQTFLDDPWITEFTAEQKSINNIIVEFAKIQGMETHFKTVPDLLDRAGRLRMNSVVSYLYQQTERKILEWLIKECEASEILLTVHDCIYTRRPINLLETRAGIREFGDFFDISHEQHRGFAYDDELQEHRAFIAEEERKAAQIFGTHTLPGRKIISATKTFNNDDSVCDSGVSYGSNEDYDDQFDPFLNDMNESELQEYRATRSAILGTKINHDTTPDWVKDLISANQV